MAELRDVISGLVGEGWVDYLLPWFESKEANKLIDHIRGRRRIRTVKVFPEHKDLFKALKLCSPEETKVVILGQDPYYYDIKGESVADGLAFSSNIKGHIPASLKIIFQELDHEYNCFPPYEENADTSLERWAKQGVLLLNTSLSVEKNKPKSHSDIGWSSLIQLIFKHLQNQRAVCYMFWGKESKVYTNLVTSKSALVLHAAHPVVHSYGKNTMMLGETFDKKKSFLGCGHFKKCNMFLESFGKSPIDWLGLN